VRHGGGREAKVMLLEKHADPAMRAAGERLAKVAKVKSPG
jgi:hypothetical protein